MERLIFTLALALTAGAIYQIAGRNRRQLNKVPEGMAILCQPPGKRYVLYALGVVVIAVVLFFSVLYIMDGAAEEARLMWGLCIVFALLTLTVTIAGGNMLAKDCVYFDGEKLQVEKPFHPSRTYRWTEIRTIRGSFDRSVSLYLLDGTKVLTADAGMVNYESFCVVLKNVCPGAATEYYRSQTYEQPKKCTLRYGGEYYLLAVMGVLILLIYLALLGQMEDLQPLEQLMQQGPSEWFALLFAPVCGAVSLIALFILFGTNIRYSPEMLTLKFPLRKSRELCWRDIQRIELILPKKREKNGHEKLRLYTGGSVYKLDLGLLTSGKDGFMTMLYSMIRHYDIPCTVTER